MREADIKSAPNNYRLYYNDTPLSVSPNDVRVSGLFNENWFFLLTPKQKNHLEISISDDVEVTVSYNDLAQQRQQMPSPQ